MVERVTNGDFSNGKVGWSVSSDCAPGDWTHHVIPNYFWSGDTALFFGCLIECGPTRVEQNVDLTNVEKITFLATSFPNSSDDPPGWVAVFIDGIHILDLPDTGEDDIEFEILLFGYSGTHLISFRTMGGEFGAFLAIGIVSAIAPDGPITPVAAFHATPLSGEAPLQVQFTDDSTNTPTSWIWDFGAGILSDLQNPLVTYLGAGVYTAKLIATNAAGSDQETKTDYITVLNPTPRYKPQSSLNICTPT